MPPRWYVDADDWQSALVQSVDQRAEWLPDFTLCLERKPEDGVQDHVELLSKLGGILRGQLVHSGDLALFRLS